MKLSDKQFYVAALIMLAALSSGAVVIIGAVSDSEFGANQIEHVMLIMVPIVAALIALLRIGNGNGGSSNRE